MDQTMNANLHIVEQKEEVEVVEVPTSEDVVSMVPFKNHIQGTLQVQ